MPRSTATGSTGDWLKPTPGRWLLALLVAGLGFLLPQEVPLVWYPLNHPGDDILYLEVTCAASAAGEVQVAYDLTHGFNNLDAVRWPVSPSTGTYTYTFPLPDAPIVGLRVKTLPRGGVLTLGSMRIVDRRGGENRRFTRDMFHAESEIAAITPAASGWQLVATADATTPLVRVDLGAPIIPAGANQRNFLRCLLSTGYLALGLWILLLAVLFIFWRPDGWRSLLARAGFLAGLAVLFAAAGNRGLIRDSVHFARYLPPPMAPALKLEFDVVSGHAPAAQVNFDPGHGPAGIETLQLAYEPHDGLQILRFPLHPDSLSAVLFNPGAGDRPCRIRGVRVVDAGQGTRAVLPLETLAAAPAGVTYDSATQTLIVANPPDATAPGLEFTPAAVDRINAALAVRSGR